MTFSGLFQGDTGNIEIVQGANNTRPHFQVSSPLHFL